MLELDHKEIWVPKILCFWTVVWEKTLESPLNWKESKPVHPKGNQFWIFLERTDVKGETPILWPPDTKSWFIRKDLNAGKDWRQEEKGLTEDEMVGWRHQLNGHQFEQALGVGQGQGSLAFCSPWVSKRTIWLSDWTEPNWSDTVKSFSIVNEAEVNVFWNSFAFSMIQRMLATWSLVPLPFLNPAWTSGCSRLTYYWSLAWRILSITLLACEVSAIVPYFEPSLALLFFGIGMKTDLFPVLWPLLSFPNLLAYWMQHFNSIIF